MPKYLAFRPTLKKYFLQLLQKNTSFEDKMQPCRELKIKSAASREQGLQFF